MKPDLALRPIRPDTLEHVLAIQAACYPAGYLESRDVFARKLNLSPDSHWLAWRGSQPLGYFFTHAWRGETPPPLAAELAVLPAAPDCHFLHDLALLPSARGTGVAQALIGAALAWGKRTGLHRTLLVAVQGSAPFWSRHGFAPLGPADGYGDGALRMIRHDGVLPAGRIR
ncbi:GNAT family N-acetyltransferase [Jeongeupia sp. USM3]|uniref:GNAT family N-acetyltransferase n=1 Tax=Jeongeupia sp. USM3 TaxID=1906741 RepID=UPI00089DE432|nr:GNAT family N-acetyltransferase [Jeongeupia sp. USM3]AOX99179.1 hypothetical protein BJP62_01145 [Jeongeupia sp. USM3]